MAHGLDTVSSIPRGYFLMFATSADGCKGDSARNEKILNKPLYYFRIYLWPWEEGESAGNRVPLRGTN